MSSRYYYMIDGAGGSQVYSTLSEIRSHCYGEKDYDGLAIIRVDIVTDRSSSPYVIRVHPVTGKVRLVRQPACSW